MTTLPEISHQWIHRKAVVGRKERLKMHAKQVPYPEVEDAFTAVVEIFSNNKLVLVETMPWPNPHGEAMLGLSLYTLAKKPNYAHPEWQPKFEELANACRGFSPPLLSTWGPPPTD